MKLDPVVQLNEREKASLTWSGAVHGGNRVLAVVVPIDLYVHSTMGDTSNLSEGNEYLHVLSLDLTAEYVKLSRICRLVYVLAGTVVLFI